MRALSWCLLALLVCGAHGVAAAVPPPGDGAAADPRREESHEQPSTAELRAYEAVESVAFNAQVALAGIAAIAALASLFIGFAWLALTRQVQKAKQAYDTLTQLQEDLVESWGRLDHEFDTIPEEELDTVPGNSDSSGFDDGNPFADTRQTLLSDYDTLLLVADRLRLSMQEPEIMAERFLRMTRFWRGQRDYARSLLRVKRARELAPQSHAALVQQAITLSGAVADRRYRHWNGIGQPPPLTPNQRQHLEEARDLLKLSDRYREKVSSKVLQQDGFIADELGDYRTAIERYEQALGLLAQENPTPEKERLQELITYNLACSQCMKGLYRSALATLAELVGKGPHLEDAATDPQLAKLREGEWQPRFEALVAEDRRLRRA